MTLISDHMNTPNPGRSETVSAEKVWDIIAAIDIAMLVTQTSDGLAGRPMSTIPRPDQGVIYMLTEADSTAARDIAGNASVLLAYQGRGDHVALAGVAEIKADTALVKELWNPGAQLFWPNGAEVHQVVAIVVDPGHADVWDGHSLLGSIASFVKGAIRGQSPDLGTRGRVDL
jgi:general stress protein 26